jgi:hypothetical protein
MMNETGRTILTIGWFIVFLGLVNPLFWASIFQGKGTQIVVMNTVFSGLLIVLGLALIRAGRSHMSRKPRDDAGQESHSQDWQ